MTAHLPATTDGAPSLRAIMAAIATTAFDSAQAQQSSDKSAWATGPSPSPAELPTIVLAAIRRGMGDGPEPIAEILWLLEPEVRRLRDAAVAVLKAIDFLWVEDISARGAIRLGDTAYVVAPDNERKLAVPIETLLAYCDINDFPLEQVFSLSERNVRITAFRALVAKSYRDGPGYRDAEVELDEAQVEAFVQTVEDTFFTKVEKESAEGRWKLKALPLKEARWAEKLTHGQRRPAKPAKKTVTPPQ